MLIGVVYEDKFSNLGFAKGTLLSFFYLAQFALVNRHGCVFL